MINRELLFLIGGRLFQIIILFSTMRLITFYLSPEEFGKYYLLMGLCTFFGYFFINPVGQFLNRKTHIWYKSGILGARLFQVSLYFLIASIFSIFIIYFMELGGWLEGVSLFWVLILIPFFIYFNSLNQTTIPLLNMLGFKGWFVLLTNLTLASSLILSLTLVVTNNTSHLSWYSGQLLGIIAIFFYSLFILKKTLNLDFIFSLYNIFTKQKMMSFFCFVFPLAIGILFLWMQTQSYRLIINKFLGAEFLGLFGVGVAISVAISTSFESIIMQMIQPKLYEKMENDGDFGNYFSFSLNAIIPIYLAMAFFVTFFSYQISNILVDQKYQTAYVFLMAGIWFEFFRIFNNYLSMIAHKFNQTKKLILPYFLGGLTMVSVLIFTSLQENYETYLPLAYVLGGGVGLIAMYFSMKKLIHIDFKIKYLLYPILLLPIFSISLLLPQSNFIITSVLILSVFGSLYLLSIYFFMRFYLKVEKDEIQ